jgi:hypothetical protein
VEGLGPAKPWQPAFTTKGAKSDPEMEKISCCLYLQTFLMFYLLLAPQIFERLHLLDKQK